MQPKPVCLVKHKLAIGLITRYSKKSKEHVTKCENIVSNTSDGRETAKSSITHYFQTAFMKSVSRRGGEGTGMYEPRQEKPGFSHMRKQRHRSALL